MAGFSTATLARLAAVFLLLVRLSCTQNNGDLRLLQKNRTDSSFTAGRLEIFINSTWGSVCADNFNMTDANVACRQLGYQGAVSTDTSFHTPFGRGQDDGPVWLDEVNCKDDLLHLLSCANDGIGQHDCTHFSDVAVYCRDEPRPASPRPMDVRLRSGQFQSEGTVEVYCDGQWSTVCDQLYFEQTEADAVCRELGYTEAVSFDANVVVENLQMSKWLGQLSCDNETSNVAACGDCSDIGTSGDGSDLPGCSVVTVQCAHTVSYGSLRLVQDSEVDPEFTHGRLEIFQDGQWGTVCSNSFSQRAADISCQQLGFLRALRFQNSQDSGFSTGPESSQQTDFQCTETDKRLVRCPRVVSSEECVHDKDVAVFCTHSHPITPVPATPPPEPHKMLPTSTLIGILVGCFLVFLLLCVGLSVITAHFCLVPYSIKKERHSLYFVEREASAERETSLNGKLESGVLDNLEKTLGDDLVSQSRSKHRNRYVSLDMSSPTTTADSSSDMPSSDSPSVQPMAEPEEVQSSVPQPIEASIVPMPSPGRVSVHSLHVLGTPQARHMSKGSISSFGSITIDSSNDALSSSQLSITGTPSPIPTPIPIPPPLKRQLETGTAPANSMSSGGMTPEDKARIKRGLVNSSFMSESEPTLAHDGFQSHVPVPISDQGNVQSAHPGSPLTTSRRAPGSQHGTPTRGIMKSPKAAKRNIPTSMPHLDKVDTMSDKNREIQACDQPNTATSDDQPTHNHHVSFMLD